MATKKKSAKKKSSKAPAKRTAKAPAKRTAKASAKRTAKAPAKRTAKAAGKKSPRKAAAKKAPARKAVKKASKKPAARGAASRASARKAAKKAFSRPRAKTLAKTPRKVAARKTPQPPATVPTTLQPPTIRKRKTPAGRGDRGPEFYEHFRQRLLSDRAQITRRLDELREELRGLDDMPREMEEWAQEEKDRDILIRLEDRETDELRKIQAALTLIDQKEYGKCQVCGRPIPRARLEELPTAFRCVDCTP